MMRAILLAPDKFKGSLSAREAAAALEKGLRTVFPAARFETAPIADGGEGTAALLCEALGGRWIAQVVQGPLGEPVAAGYAWIAGPPPYAVLEMSAASGLARTSRRAPCCATTYGTGELLADAMGRGAGKVIVGLGGSATTDGGAGMAEALGYRFLNGRGETLPGVTPRRFREIARIVKPQRPAFPEIVAACDVESPLLGPRGAARLFSPQKGAGASEVEALEEALAHLAAVVEHDLGVAPASRPGAGAAGGLGFGLMAFCGASIRPGFDLVAGALGLEAAIARADLVVTGEGSLDEQTLEGKGPARVAALARKAGKPVIALGGRVSAAPGLRALFDDVEPLDDPAQPPVPLAQSMAQAAHRLEAAAARIGKRLVSHRHAPGSQAAAPPAGRPGGLP